MKFGVKVIANSILYFGLLLVALLLLIEPIREIWDSESGYSTTQR